MCDQLIGPTLYALYKYKNSNKNIVIFASNNYELNRLKSSLANYIPSEDFIYFEEDELIRVEYISRSKEMNAQELYALDSLLNAQHKIILLSPSSLYRFYPNKNVFKAASFSLKINDVIDVNELVNKLTRCGYLKVNKIDQSLQFAKRGDIVDVFPINSKNPIRIEFFDDQIESIREFDISTQLSINKIDSIKILPASILVLDPSDYENNKGIIVKLKEKSMKSLLDYGKKNLEIECDRLLEEVENGFLSSRNYKYYGLLNKNCNSIIDYISNYDLIIANEEEFKRNKESLFLEADEFMNELISAGKALLGVKYFSSSVNEVGNPIEIDVFNEFYSHKNSFELPYKRVSFYNKHFKNVGLLINEYLKNNYKIICCIDEEYQLKKLKEYLLDANIEFSEVNELKENIISNVLILHTNLYEGFENSLENIVFLSSNELFGIKHSKSRFYSKFKEGTVLNSYLELNSGDYVVHETKGIGKFLEITTMLQDGKHKDYLKIEYANNEHLYVPLYQFDLVRKYSGRDGYTPQLSRLTSKDWEKKKQKIKEKINDLSERLLNLYQERKNIQGFAFEEDNDLQKEFEDKFEFNLTDDQIKSLDEIKKDMEASSPMDRLLCGDVGFGKTEVAFRAAFKAILSGKQVCLLCPTTVLAKQHYEVALERFKDFGVNIVHLSRLNTDKNNKEITEQIKDGKADFVIGTHKVLSKTVQFKNLGLLIIDEEQRFGVEQKEKIKERYKNLDVLTLSATPIPRTLQSSLIGLKSVSNIKTAPRERMPIQTYVTTYDENLLRDIIKRELARDGQIYFVYNYIDNIYNMASLIQKLIPNIKIGVIHGRLEKADIDDVMNSFYNHEIDLLCSTSIIENGIDVKNANLIIIYDADHFGLSQLYQIKGRVGRGDRLAYAYLMIRSNKEITDDAKKRLKSIQDFTELGSGYKISQRDLIIRGAGDILGPQQSGFIDEIGIDLYLKILKETIEEKKSGKPVVESLPVFSNLNIDAYIPSTYVNDENKLEIYQRIIEAKDENSLIKIKNEIKDIYGQIPDSVNLLFDKRKIDIKLEKHDIFNSLNEDQQFVIVNLSAQFSSIDGIGTNLFTSLISLVNVIKITYTNKRLSIKVYKRNNWVKTLNTILETCENLYNKVEEKDVYED